MQITTKPLQYGFVVMKCKLIPPETLKWLEWAERKADWYDPLMERPDELLADVGQNTLEFLKKPYGFGRGY